MISKKNCKAYCCEDLSKIENYDKAVADTTQVWVCHHRLEVQGQFINSVELLKRCRMYWKRPANELIFLTRSNHTKLHSKGKPSHRKGKHLTEETRRKLSEANRGKKMSEESRRKLSEWHKGRPLPEETKRKMSTAAKDWWAKRKAEAL